MTMVLPTEKPKQLGTVNLFRFFNYADPKTTLPSAGAASAFIEHPAPAASGFLSAIADLTTPQEINEALAPVLADFSPLTSAQQVIAVNPELYSYGLFVSKFSSATTIENLDGKALGVARLTAAQKAILWENLYYQAIKTGSTLIADAIVSIIRADAFLAEFRANRETATGEITDTPLENYREALKYKASANIVIPIKLVGSETVASPAPKNGLDQFSKQALRKKNNADKARYQISNLHQVINEVKLADARHNQETTEAYNEAHTAYIAEYRQSLDCKGIEEPVFTFTAASPFDPEFLSANLSDKALTYLNAVKHRTHKSFKDVLKALDSRLQSEYNSLSKNADTPNKKVLMGDMEIAVSKKPKNNSFVITSEKKFGSDDLYNVFVTHYFESAETATTYVEVEATGATGPAYTAASAEPVSKSDSHATFLLFEEGLPLTAEGYTIVGRYDVESSSFSSEFAVPEFDLRKPFFGDLQFGAQEILQLLNTDHDLEPGTEEVPLYGVKRIGVLEYKRVEQRICCYVAGEVSHIENVMAREYKEKSTRSLTRTETIQEDTQEREVENLKDTTSTDRHEMNSEVSQVLQEEQARQIGVNAGGSFTYNGSPYVANVFANTNMNFTNSSSQNNSVSTSQAFAKEVVEKATQRIVEKVSSKRTSRMLREFEENNKHGYDNRLGSSHVTGIYRWVDKIYENTLVNYGKRLQYDFMVPEPSKNFKNWIQDSKKSKQKTVEEPKTPASFGIKPFDFLGADGKTVIATSEWGSVTKYNYAAAAAAYGADVDPCPEQYLNIGKSFSENPTGKVTKWDESIGSYAYEIEIPDGYSCKNFWGIYAHTMSYKSPEGTMKSEADIQIDTSHFWIHRPNGWCLAFDNDGTGGSTNFHNTNSYMNVYKKLPVSISTFNVSGFSMSIVAGCELTTDAYQNWQQATYASIITAYYKKLEEYNNANAVALAENSNEKIDYKYNPLTGRAIEQRELKRLCIELMLEPFGIVSGRENYVQDPCFPDNYNINRTAGFEKHASYVRFMEEAFQWDLMSYSFFPYYWAGEASWKDLIQQSSTSDELFQAFLQSGMARITVPVRLKFEYAVVYLMNTGKIWKSNILAAGDNKDLYTSIDELLRFDEGVAEAQWHTRIPTELTIIQNDSSPLDEKGLPCEWSYNNLGQKVYCENGEPIAADPTTYLNGLDNSTSGNGGSAGAAPKGTFKFPKANALSAADIGKVVVNNGGGVATLPQLSPSLPSQTGKFRIAINDLSDIWDQSSIKIETEDHSYTFNRLTWRGPYIPETPAEELTILRNHLETFYTSLGSSNLVFSVVDANTLEIEEVAVDATRIELNDFPGDSLTVVRFSKPETPAAITGYPLGKLVGFDGDNALISNEMVETYTLESEFTVNNSVFTTESDLDFTTEAGFRSVFDHLMIPTTEGKVKPAGLLPTDFNSSFPLIYRNQFVGVAIASQGLEVTVVKLSYLSVFFHLMKQAAGKGLIFND
jgi:hypothetical protein